jgi:hypothetical protein
MFKKQSFGLLEIAFVWLTSYMGRAGLILYAGEFDASTPEAKAAIKDAVEKAVAEATEGLADKNKQLLAELKEAKKGKTIDPSEVADLERQVETLQGDLKKAQGELKTANATAEKATKDLATEQAFTQKLLVDNGLGDELVKAGVSNPVHLKAVKAILASQVKIVADGENRNAMVGDKKLADFVKEYAASDEGKHFVTASSNSGGNGNGGSSTAKPGKTMTRTAFDALDAAGKSAFGKEGGTLTDG